MASTAPDVVVVDTPAGRVRVRDTGGAGTPVLLVHSLLVDADLYASLVPLLTARGHRCLVPELPLGAHGEPLAPDADLTPPGLARLLVAVLDARGIDRVHVVGVDTGGALTQLLMADHRDRVERVVLTACDAYDQFPPTTTLLARLLPPLFRRAPLTLAAAVLRLRPARRLLVPRSVTHRGVTDALLRQWSGPLRDPAVRRDVRAAVAAMDPQYTLAAAAANRDFPRPVLVAWGDDDRLFPRRLGERLATDLPQARLATIEDCAAFAAVDQPDVLAALVHDHVTTGAPVPRTAGAGAVDAS